MFSLLNDFTRVARTETSLAALAAAVLDLSMRSGLDGGGAVFCFRRPTQNPEWLCLGGCGTYAGIGVGRIDELPSPERERIVGAIERDTACCDARGDVVCIDTDDGHAARIVFREPLAAAVRTGESIDMLRERVGLALDDLLLRGRLNRVHQATVATLATLAEYKDADTGNHVSRVARLVTEVAERMARNGRVPAHELPVLGRIGQASVLHDIGKVGIPDRILLKPGGLDGVERTAMQEHTRLGHDILLKSALSAESTELMRLAATIARSHHERYDGGGYPDGLAGDDIPLAARIVAVIDVYDALVSARPYKEPWPEDKAMALIREQSGRHFDPDVVDSFLAVMNGEPGRRKFVVWNDAFALGHDAIDADHRKLFGILNHIWLAKESSNRQLIEMALDDLVFYTASHFEREETQMSARAYPEAMEHRAAHEAFAGHVEALRWEYLFGLRQDIHDKLLAFLADWLVGHIGDVDRRLAEFFVRGGVPA